MGTVHLVEPADPGFRPCPLCLMAAKQYQWSLYQEMIEGFLKDADDKAAKWIPWPDGGPLIREGSWRGVPGDAPNLGLVDGLCWDHLAGFDPNPKPASGLLDGAGLPPGLLRKGRPGA
jgi:hypothetical protein